MCHVSVTEPYVFFSLWDTNKASQGGSAALSIGVWKRLYITPYMHRLTHMSLHNTGTLASGRWFFTGALFGQPYVYSEVGPVMGADTFVQSRVLQACCLRTSYFYQHYFFNLVLQRSTWEVAWSAHVSD
jgi:hypothetical protein